MDKKLIFTKAREYVGTPFHQQGRVKGLGMDCVGIMLCVGEDLGLRYKDGRPIRRFDYMNYGLYPVLDEMQREMKKIFTEKPLAEISPGDILTMRAPFLVHHIAIVSELQGGLGIIHAYGSENVSRNGRGRVSEHPLSQLWKSRIASVFSYSAVDD